jgi:hypothetical protein
VLKLSAIVSYLLFKGIEQKWENIWKQYDGWC